VLIESSELGIHFAQCGGIESMSVQIADHRLCEAWGGGSLEVFGRNLAEQTGKF
jgi:hypothetical protein